MNNLLPNPEIDNTNGILYFYYIWGSTNGDNGSLLGNIHEHVEYSGDGANTTDPATPGVPARGFFDPSPSFDSGWRLHNPTDTAVFAPDASGGAVWILASDKGFTDHHVKKSGFTPGPYVAAQFQGAQEYRYQCDDPLCPDHNMRWTAAAFGNKKAVGNSSATTGTIARSITPAPGGASATYSVSKQGVTATAAVP